MAWVVPVVAFAACIISITSHHPQRKNPTFVDIQTRLEAEQAKKDAENVAKAALERAKLEREVARLERELAHVRQEKAEMAAARAEQEVKRMKAQIEMAAKRAEELANEATKAAKGEATRLAQEAQAEWSRSQMREEAETTIAAVKEEAEDRLRQVVAGRMQAQVGEVKAEEAVRVAVADIQKAMEAKEEAERLLKRGIQLVATPTPDKVFAVAQHIRYREDRFHFAIAGISGSGKSSLANAFRGLEVKDAGAAKVDITKTTLHITRYADSNPKDPVMWYDIPSAGTIQGHDWQYFNDQGLYAFDCIIVLLDDRFTMTDLAILVNARRFNIPTYIVRSKADQHIRNVVGEMGYSSEGEKGGDVEHRAMLYKVARKQYIGKTRRNVKANLLHMKLPDQRAYIVSSDTLLSIVQKKTPKNVIDEGELLDDVTNEAHRRRKLLSFGGTS